MQASSVWDALRQVTLFPPDLALVDIGLPDGDGLELSRKLTTALPSVRVVLVSADSDATTQKSAREAGAVGFLAKGDLSCAVLDSLLKSE
jgi:DNA-binding NarL/FixJ family response regulator